jgi:hypothetical protein
MGRGGAAHSRGSGSVRVLLQLLPFIAEAPPISTGDHGSRGRQPPGWCMELVLLDLER